MSLRALRALGLAGLVALLLSACANTGSVDGLYGGASPGYVVGDYKVGKPYSIKGKRYFPREDFSYRETGVASWYGPGFHGKSTASGAPYDMNALTAAHRTLPMPSLVRVTNIENGRQVDLLVNDRGPFAKGRILDVSRRGAEVLGFREKGTARVRVEILETESRRMKQIAMSGGKVAPPTSANTTVASRRARPLFTSGGVAAVASDPLTTSRVVRRGLNGQLFVQVGAYLDPLNAEGIRRRLGDLGSTWVTPIRKGSQQLYRVRIGPVDSRPSAERIRLAALEAGADGARIVVD